MSNPLWPYGLQHTSLPCPSPTPGAYSNSCPLSQWCHTPISSSVLYYLLEFPQIYVHWVSDAYLTISSSVLIFSFFLQSFPASEYFPMCQIFPSGNQILGFSLQHQFFGAQSSLWSSSRTCTWLFEKPQLWLYRPLSAKWCLYILMHCLVWSYLSFQGASIFQFHGLSNHPQWFWSPRK